MASESTKAIRRHSPKCYALGWIAALPIERAAAQACLDERHEAPKGFVQHPSDTNSYTWGNMSGHDTIIASLPSGVYGTNSAASTASQLLASMPHIQMGMLVGIAGGIPRPHSGQDIRLGDVVVSQPAEGTGGVFQYDLGKALAGQTWEASGMLNRPPQALLSAVAKCQEQHRQGSSSSSSSKMPTYLAEMVRMRPKMAINYEYQGRENDRLFAPDYDHAGGQTCAQCGTEHEIERPERLTTDPKVHYGIIASGNTLVKDAAARDQLVTQSKKKLLCVEMEAAGMMNHFPCLVIRGICDYADSHKNDRWQRYASATAAACAKEILTYVPRKQVEEEQETSRCAAM